LIRVLIVDDNAIIREGITRILASVSDITVVGEACNGTEAVSKALELKPDVIFMDICMPQASGLEAIEALRDKLPGARIIVLTVSARDEHVFPALRLGAKGYLLKDATIAEMIGAVKKVAAGETILSAAITSKLVNDLNEKDDRPSLSAREREILDMVSQGLSNTEIAGKLFISESTVRTYLHRLFEKLHVKNRAETVSYSLRNRY
jgi:NarL family two-component system response regulator LiaR